MFVNKFAILASFISLFLIVEAEDVAKANRYVDRVIEGIKGKDKSKLEPFDLPNHEIGFDKWIGLIHFKGSAKLFEGEVYGIGSTIQRDEDAEILEKNGNVSTTAKVKLSMGVLNYQYKARVSVGDKWEIHKDAKFSGDIGHADVVLTFKHDNERNTNTLVAFELTDLRGITFKVEGVPFSGFQTLMDKLFMNIFPGLVKKVANYEMKKVVADIFEKTNTLWE